MPNLGPAELIIILVIILVVFGAGKLPEIGGALGRGIREFKAATKEVDAAKKEVDAAKKDLSDVAREAEQATKPDQPKEG